MPQLPESAKTRVVTRHPGHVLLLVRFGWPMIKQAAKPALRRGETRFGSPPSKLYGIIPAMQIIHMGEKSPSVQTISGEQIRVELGTTPRRYYRHGWQSWSLAAWTDAALRLPVPKPYSVLPQHVDPQWALH